MFYPPSSPGYDPAGYDQPFTPRYSVPESFRRALSYEGQLHLLACLHDQLESMVEGKVGFWIVDSTVEFDRKYADGLLNKEHAFDVTWPTDGPVSGTDVIVATGDVVAVRFNDTTDGGMCFIMGNVVEAYRCVTPERWNVAVRMVVHDITDKLDKLYVKVDAISAKDVELETRLGTVESTVNTLSDNVDEIEAKDVEFENRFVTVESTVNSLSSSLVFIDATKHGVSTDNVDNSEALQSIIDDCASKGRVCYLPDGVYRCSSRISIPWGMRLQGQSMANTVIEFSSDAGFVADRVDKNGYKTGIGIEISYIQIVGPYKGQWVRNMDTTYSEAWSPNAVNRAGIGGWISASHIHDIVVKYFKFGIATWNPSFTGSDFNTLYNYVYGDNRIFENITVSENLVGIVMGQSDSMLRNIIVAGNGNYYPIMMNGGLLESSHLWGVPNAVFIQGGCRVTNIEVESIFVAVDDNGKCKNNFNGLFYITNNSGNPVVIEKAYIWNFNFEPQKVVDDGKTIMPMFRADSNTNTITIINNLSLGRNRALNDPDVVPAKLWWGQNPKGSAVISGAIAPTIKSFYEPSTSDHIAKSLRAAYSGQGSAVFNVFYNGDSTSMPSEVTKIPSDSKSLTLTYTSR